MKNFKFYSGILVAIFFMYIKIQAQTIPCFDPATYSCQDLLHPINGLVVARDLNGTEVKKYYYGKPSNSPVDYNSVDQTCSNAGDALFFTVTYPGNYNYSTCPALPCIVLFHPGGYKESATLNPFKKYADEFAKRGYVAFNVEYRSGWDTEPPQNNYLSTGQMIAAYRAEQDIRGALKTIVKMKNQGTFTNFNFDLNKVYIGGASAGAFMCINIAYVNQAEIDTVAPGVQAVLGQLNSPLSGSYVGSGTPLPSINGVMCLWGGGPGLLGGASPSFINGNNLPPFIAFHGEADIVAPFDHRDEFYCDDTKYSQYAAITQCSGAQTVQFDIRNNDNDPAADYTNYGSNAIYNRLRTNTPSPIPAEIYLDSDMGHGLDATSDFGIGTNDQNQVISYMVGRTATFFQAVAAGSYTFTHTKFRDCENTRKGCEPEPVSACASSKPAKSSIAVNKESLTGLKISPNPASTQFKIEMNSKEVISSVNVYNQAGKLMLQKKVNASLFNISRTEVGNAPGLYIVETTSAGKTTRKKVLVL